MSFFEAMSIDQLNRILAGSRWILGLLAVLTAFAGTFNLWLGDRIADLQRIDKVKAQERLHQTETELSQTKEKTAELQTQVDRFTVPRVLSSEQIATLRQCLAAGAKGKVIVTL